MLTFWCPFSGLGNRSENGAPQGGGHAIRPRRRMFREGRPSSLRLHFGLHFGVILGAKFATMLLFCRPGEHFGGLGGPLEQVGLLMYFGTSPGTAQIEVIRSGEGERSVPGALPANS